MWIAVAGPAPLGLFLCSMCSWPLRPIHTIGTGTVLYHGDWIAGETAALYKRYLPWFLAQVLEPSRPQAFTGISEETLPEHKNLAQGFP